MVCPCTHASCSAFVHHYPVFSKRLRCHRAVYKFDARVDFTIINCEYLRPTSESVFFEIWAFLVKFTITLALNVTQACCHCIRNHKDCNPDHYDGVFPIPFYTRIHTKNGFDESNSPGHPHEAWTPDEILILYHIEESGQALQFGHYRLVRPHPRQIQW